MNDLSNVRKVVARFFQVSEAEVTDAFVFPAHRIQGSLGRSVFHAAIKRLANVDLPAAFTATTYGDLIRGGAGSAVAAGLAPMASGGSAIPPVLAATVAKPMPLQVSMGVDLAVLGEIPGVGTAELAAWEAEHFSAGELAYARSRPEPRVTLLGLWAAKEAVLKCGWAGRLEPREVAIAHGATGEPVVTVADPRAGSLAISISHAGEMAIAVCVRMAG